VGVGPQSETSPAGPVKAAALAVLLLGFLVLVTIAASGSRATGHGHVAPRPVPATVQDSWITLLAIAYGIVIVGVLIAMFSRRHGWRVPESHWLRNYAIVLVVMMLAAGIGSWAISHGHIRLKAQNFFAQQSRQGQGKGAGSDGAGPAAVRAAHIQWPLVFALGGLLALGGVWMLVRRSRLPELRTPDPESVEEELSRAIGSSIEDLRAERDPRRAVIAAYANLERVLRAHGLARRPAEVPHEYLARVLTELEVRDSAVRALTELFEYAKFSPHEIDLTMKEKAIDSLVMVREDLDTTKELAA
jgi:hypothetical protein